MVSDNLDSNLELKLFKSLFSFKVVYEKPCRIKELRTVGSLVKELYFNRNRQAIAKDEKFH